MRTLIEAVLRRLREISAPGLSWRQRLRQVPLLGFFLAWCHAILRLPAMRLEVAREFAELREQQQEADRLRHLTVMDIVARLDAIEATNATTRLNRLEGMNIGYRLNRLDALDVANRLNVFDAINIANRLNDIDASLREQRAAGLARGAASGEAPDAAQGAFDAEAFYLDFEDQFRGARETIKNRMGIYLPRFAQFAGDEGARVADIGCGRGEWLELLAENRIAAIGIDSNSAMARACRQRGLAAECADAIAWLKQQPPGSLAAVTGFHVIEHLPFETLIALFDAALHALRADGLVLFETPNAENLAVGASNFYSDPTHQRPILPATAQFIARQRGFAQAEILRVNPYPDSYLLPEDDELARRINQLLYGPQDYAVLAWKTRAL